MNNYVRGTIVYHNVKNAKKVPKKEDLEISVLLKTIYIARRRLYGIKNK